MADRSSGALADSIIPPSASRAFNSTSVLGIKLYILILFLLALLFSAFVLVLLFRRRYSAKQGNRVLLKQSSGVTPLVSKYIDGGKGIEEVGILVRDGSGSASSSASVVSAEVQNIGWGRWYGLKELEAATRGFAEENVVGEGGYGVVYRGVLEDEFVHNK